MKNELQRIALQYSIITASCALYALAFCWFYAPNQLSAGGFTGLAQVVNVFLPWLPIGVQVVAWNVPLFILIWKKVGRDWLAASLYAAMASALFIDIIQRHFVFQPLEPMLACIYGGIAIGVSCGWMLRQSATVGGTELAARLLRLRWERVSIGTLCCSMDGLIVILYALVLSDISRAMYALVSLGIISLTMDRVVYGGSAEVACIVSDRYEELTMRLLAIRRGVTLLKGEGGFTQRDTKVVMCAFDRRQIVEIKKLVQEVDPAAFVIVYDAHEILGEGFGAYQAGGV